MTKEQEILFEKKVWNWQITENTTEYEIAKSFFELGLNMAIDEALNIIQSKKCKMYVHNLPADDSNPLSCICEAIKEIKNLRN